MLNVEVGRDPSALQQENQTLYAVIDLVSSSLELRSILRGIVDLATAATGCHACFIYLLEDERLTIRAASPVFSHAVDRVQFSVNEGLTGWVARHRCPAFIRDQAMQDPRMKFVSLLEEERFQSMVAVPILARSGQTIGVIVLHTQAPHEFEEDTLNLLQNIASLIGGALENAQLYERERHRVDMLTDLSALAQEVSSAPDRAALGELVTRSARRLLGAQVCQLFLSGSDGAELLLLGSSPEAAPAPASSLAAVVLLGALNGRRRSAAATLWPKLTDAKLLVAPLTAGEERLGVLCAASHAGRSFSDEQDEVARALAHLTALAIKRVELIEGLTTRSAVKELFEALMSGATALAAAKAEEVHCPLTDAYVMVCAEPAETHRWTTGWLACAEEIGRALSASAPRSAVEAGPGPVRAVLSIDGSSQERTQDVLAKLRELGRRTGATIGLSERYAVPEQAPRALREAADAAGISRALAPGGGAIAYAELGAYRYLVRIHPDDVPRDRMRAAVDALIAYDSRRHTALLDTLERFLVDRGSVVDSSRALFIHPNTLRQRLARIEELTGLKLDQADLLSLELAIKLARLQVRPNAAPAA